jgi:TPR repeat protein
MPDPSYWSSLNAQLEQFDFSNAAGDARKYSDAGAAAERADAASNAAFKRQLGDMNAAVQAGQQDARSTDKLPEDFVPILEVKGLPMLGTWPVLQDNANAYDPGIRTMALVMGPRAKEGDAYAQAWVDVFLRALAGEAGAQRLMGDILENGRFETPVDLQRAFFWYYRAGLAGDAEAQESAFRLKSTMKIDPATMKEPQFIAAGRWSATVDVFGQDITTHLLDFRPDGSLTGKVTAHGGTSSEMARGMFADDPAMLQFMAAKFQTITSSGRWSYDQEHLLLTLTLQMASPGIRSTPASTSRITLRGAKLLTLFGRDEQMVSFYLQRQHAGA